MPRPEGFNLCNPASGNIHTSLRISGSRVLAHISRRIRTGVREEECGLRKGQSMDANPAYLKSCQTHDSHGRLSQENDFKSLRGGKSMWVQYASKHLLEGKANAGTHVETVGSKLPGSSSIADEPGKQGTKDSNCISCGNNKAWSQ